MKINDMSFLKPEIQHFTHIHSLTKVEGYGKFICGGCKTYGFRTTYRCSLCNYNLHEHCATCPPTLLNFMHPQHELRLVFGGPEQTHQNRRMCDICDGSVEGLYYQCELCDFDIHPLCTQMPQHVRHAPHPDHLLELSQNGATNTCMVCCGTIRSWRYKCGPCGVDVHKECVDSSVFVAATVTPQKSYGSYPHSHPPQYYPYPHPPQYYPHPHPPQYYPHPHPPQHYPYSHPPQYPQVNPPQNYPSYHHHQYNYGYNQSQVHDTRPSIKKRMYGLLTALTVGVVGDIIVEPISELFIG